MARNITVTFDDGSTHVYQNAPDDITPDQVQARAEKEFGLSVTNLDGGRGTPEPTVMDRIGDAMNSVRDTMTGTTAPKRESVLQGVKLEDPVGENYDAGALTALSNLPRGQKAAAEKTAIGKRVLEAPATIGPIRAPEATASNVMRAIGSDLAVGAKRADAGLDKMFSDATGSQYLEEQAKKKLIQAGLTEAINTPEFESETAQGIYGGLSSLIKQSPAMAAAVITRNPTVALSGMVLPMVPESYGKYRDRGAEPSLALAGALADAGIEYATEKMPMSTLVAGFGKKGFAAFTKDLLGKEVPGEQWATLLQDAVDTAIANPNKTWEDYAKERPGAMYQTLVATITQAGAMSGAHAAVKGLDDYAAGASADRSQANATNKWMDAFAPAREAQLPATPVAPRVQDQPTTPTVPNVGPTVGDPITGMDDASILNRIPVEGQDDQTNTGGPVNPAAPAVQSAADSRLATLDAALAGQSVPNAGQPAQPAGQPAAAATVSNPASAIPTATDPRSNLANELAALRQRSEQAAAKAEAERVKAEADAAAKTASIGSNYQQKDSTPVSAPGAIPNPQAVTALVEAGKGTAGKYADVGNTAIYTEPVLYGIINHPNVGPELLDVARTELNRRRGKTPNVNVNTSASITGIPGNTGTRVDSQQSSGLPSTQSVDSAGRANTDTQAVGNPPGLSTGTAAVGNQPATGTATTANVAGNPAFSNNPAASTGPVNLKPAPQAPKVVTETQLLMLQNMPEKINARVSQKPLTEEQQLVSHFVGQAGKTITWVESADGRPIPDGWLNELGGKHIFIDVNGEKPLLETVLHEGVHALPDHIRIKLVRFILQRTSADGQDAFLNRYGYEKLSPKRQAEEIGAYVGQLIARKPGFIQDLKTALGNKDFAEFARVLIGKMKDWLGKGDSQFDSTFLAQHVRDVQGIHNELVKAYAQAMQEQGLTPDANVVADAGPVMATKSEATPEQQSDESAELEGFTPTKATAEEIKQADEYEAENGIRPYTSEGQLEVPIAFALKQQYGEKDLAKGRENHPILGLPMNKDGTVTLYYPATNEVARQLAKDKVLRGATPQSTRIYLTNESSGPKVMEKPGQMDQALGGANVMLMIDPSWVHVANEYEDGRKDFYIPIAEGKAFAEKMKMVKLFTVDGPRDKALSKSVTINDIADGVTRGVQSYMAMGPKEKTARHKAAKAKLLAEHNVTVLLGENGKLQKTRVGDYGLRDEATDKSVASMGLGLASAQKINEKLSTCPQSARCESLCLGDTSGQNLLYGGDGQFRSGPRMSQYLKTEALVLNPEDFSIVLAREIESFVKWAESEKGFEMLPGPDGQKVQTPKQSYKPAIRLNVTSDFPPKVFEALIKAFPQVEFYDYTKLNSDSIADNHHLTYSSTGVLQRVNGKILGKGEGLASGKGAVKSNWDAMVKKMERGFNVAMAFTSRNDIPKFLLDEKTGQKFEVWDGDNYDARFLDPARYTPDGRRVGMIIGLTNKDRTGKPEDAATKYDGFFVDYNKERDGDTLVIQDQEALASGRKVIPIAKAETEVAFANKATGERQIGINVRTDTKAGLSYADLIVDGQKKYETRDTDSLRPYVGRTVGIVRTGEGTAKAIGSVKIGEPLVVGEAQFNKLRSKHLVPAGSEFDIKPGGKKYLYPVTEAKRFDEEYDVEHGIVGRAIKGAPAFSNRAVNKLNDPAVYADALAGFVDYYSSEERAREYLDYYKADVQRLIDKGGSIYRMVWAPSVDAINTGKFGDHWTTHQSNLDKLDHLAPDGAWKRGDKRFVIEAKVPPGAVSNEDVDIRGNPEEEEVNIVGKNEEIEYVIRQLSGKMLGEPLRTLKGGDGVHFSNKPKDLDQDITLTIPVEGGKTAKLTVNAKSYLDTLNKREDALRMVKECMI